MERYLVSCSGRSTDAAQEPAVYAAVRVIKRVVGLLIRWQERATERCRLAELDHSMLDDMGLDPSAARHESTKPFWRS